MSTTRSKIPSSSSTACSRRSRRAPASASWTSIVRRKTTGRHPRYCAARPLQPGTARSSSSRSRRRKATWRSSFRRTGCLPSRRSSRAGRDSASGRGCRRRPLLVHHEEKRVVDQAFEPRADPLHGDDGEALRLEERPPRLRRLEGERRVHSPAVAVPVEAGVEEIEPEALGAAPVDRLYDQEPARVTRTASARTVSGVSQWW